MVCVGCLRLIHHSIVTLASWRPQHLVHFNNKAKLRDFIAVTGLLILPKLDSKHWLFGLYDIEIWWMTSKNNMAPLLCYASFVHQFKGICEFQLESWNAQFWSKSAIFFLSRDLEIWQMSLKNNRAPFNVLSSFENHFLAFGELELELPSRNASYG